MTASFRHYCIALMAPGGLLLSACATSAPDAASLLPPAPQGWAADPAASGAGPSAGDWMADFDDPALPGLAAEAVARNADFRAALARLDQARASAVIAGAPRLPALDASAGANLVNAMGFDPLNPGAGLARGTTETYSLGASVSWEADVWGRVASTARAADLDALASAADLAAARLSLAGSAAQSWFALIEAELQADLAARDVDNRERSLDFIDRRYRGGVSTSLDVRLARSALASSRAALAARVQMRDEAARQLETLLGRYPAAELAAARDLPGLAPLGGLGAPGDLLWRRPDLVAADLRLEAAGLRADAARAALAPRLTLQAGANSSAADIGDLLNVDSLVGTLAGNLAQPIFRAGALRADVDRSDAATQERLAAYAGAALTAWREAENALAAETLLAGRAEDLRVAFEEAARAEELAERQYNQGLASIFNLLDAQGRRISAESQHIAARRERAANRVRLYLSIGGDFAAAPLSDLAAHDLAILRAGSGLEPAS